MIVKQNVLEKLEWRYLTDALAGFCKTKIALNRSMQLKPDLKREVVEERWRLVEPLRQLVNSGYNPPISELDEMSGIFRSISVGQILTGQDLRLIYNLLMIVKSVHKFCTDFSGRCQTLKHFHARTYPLPRIIAEIEKTVDAEGQLLDDASEELSSIRKGKVAMRKRIESVIKGLFHDSDLTKYLQDDFFTIRAERYVVPIKLDGRGRIKGSIYDTSDSGQTLFIEPSTIAPLNEQLLELELSEKLEVLRIFRALGEKIATELDILTQNYQEIAELDFLTAQAFLAKKLDANPIKLSDRPLVNLQSARHPVLALDASKMVIANHIELKVDQNALVISGPNAGGKTVVLKTLGLIQLMAKAGLLVPAADHSELFLYDAVYLELGDAQNLVANLSTFSGHLMGIKPILQDANERSMVLLDEIAAGTEPQAGAALAQSILEELVERRATTLATTHFDTLKGLAVSDPRYRNGSMEYSLNTLKPTYRLILDVPGQSYGIELAEHLGLPSNVIERAKQLRGAHANQLDQLINELNDARTTLRSEAEVHRRKVIELESAKDHWEREKLSLEEARRTASQTISARYEEQMTSMRIEYDEIMDAMRKKLRELDTLENKSVDSARDDFQGLKQSAKTTLDKLSSSLGTLSRNDQKSFTAAPQPSLRFEDLKEHLKVHVKSLNQDGVVSKVPNAPTQPVEIRMGLLNLRVDLSDLTHARSGGGSQQGDNKRPLATKYAQAKNLGSHDDIPFTPQTATNSVDLRGMDSLDAVEHMWRFVDLALRKGEPCVVVIHGHGYNKLKPAIRDALANNPPYALSYRPGDEKEGGDGVTIVAFDK